MTATISFMSFLLFVTTSDRVHSAYVALDIIDSDLFIISNV